MAGISGVCAVAYLQTAGPTGGTGYELSVLAATIIGIQQVLLMLQAQSMR